MKSPSLEYVADLLMAHRFHFTCEDELQRGIEHVLRECEVPFEREPPLTRTERPDFLVDGAIAVEIKIQGSPTQVLRQLSRYAGIATIEAILLVTTRNSHRSLPTVLHGKPIQTVYLNPL